MHQDQRIGLALGVLLIGACAAFFFRNETQHQSESLRLQHAKALDERIAERATRPYLNGIEVVESATRARMRTVADRGTESDDDHGYWSPVDSYGRKSSNDKSSGQRSSRASLADSESDVQELDPIPLPGDKIHLPEKSSARESGDEAGHIGLKSTNTNADTRSHVVQKGETLSSIASKLLGNSNRFHEIFEANRDQLHDANDLRSGMVLRMPDSRNAAPSTQSMDATKEPSTAQSGRRSTAPRVEIDESPNGSNSNDKADSLPREETTPRNRFVPARRFTAPGRPQANAFDLIFGETQFY